MLQASAILRIVSPSEQFATFSNSSSVVLAGTSFYDDVFLQMDYLLGLILVIVVSDSKLAVEVVTPGEKQTGHGDGYAVVPTSANVSYLYFEQITADEVYWFPGVGFLVLLLPDHWTTSLAIPIPPPTVEDTASCQAYSMLVALFHLLELDSHTLGLSYEVLKFLELRL